MPRKPLNRRDRRAVDAIVRPAERAAPLLEAIREYVQSDEFETTVRAIVREELEKQESTE